MNGFWVRGLVAGLLVTNCLGSAVQANQFCATVEPTSVCTGDSVDLLITVTNTAGSSLVAGQRMQSVDVAVPAGWGLDAVPTFVVTASNSKAWSATLAGSTIRLRATNAAMNANRLDKDESVSVAFTATSPMAAGSSEWTTAAGNGVDGDGNTNGSYSSSCSQPEVTVNSCSTCNATGTETCSQGFWKNHQSEWAGYAPGDLLGDVFDFSGVTQPTPLLSNMTLAQALSFPGGAGLPGGQRILLRAAVAALLNATHPDVDYDHCTSEVIDIVNAALASNNRAELLLWAGYFDELNQPTEEKVCPLPLPATE